MPLPRQQNLEALLTQTQHLLADFASSRLWQTLRRRQSKMKSQLTRRTLTLPFHFFHKLISLLCVHPQEVEYKQKLVLIAELKQELERDGNGSDSDTDSDSHRKRHRKGHDDDGFSHIPRLAETDIKSDFNEIIKSIKAITGRKSPKPQTPALSLPWNTDEDDVLIKNTINLISQGIEGIPALATQIQHIILDRSAAEIEVRLKTLESKLGRSVKLWEDEDTVEPPQSIEVEDANHVVETQSTKLENSHTQTVAVTSEALETTPNPLISHSDAQSQVEPLNVEKVMSPPTQSQIPPVQSVASPPSPSLVLLLDNSATSNRPVPPAIPASAGMNGSATS
eukprot:c4359_g1_i3.p1 GENE.c4359_g1_i3~~c4359_g1_i3.p1  ORF type:complete len:338 (-),score=46.33 c4359_g1_i3:77-1090(-)